MGVRVRVSTVVRRQQFELIFAIMRTLMTDILVVYYLSYSSVALGIDNERL